MITWYQCQNPMGGHNWPDGGPLLDQPVRLVRAFQIIGAESRWWDKNGPQG